MLFDDDDELADIQPTPEKQFTRADRGKRDELREQIKSETGKEVKHDEAKLHAKVNLKQLKNNVAGKMDEEDKRKEKAEKEAEESETFVTKTRKQEEEESISTAQDKATPDKMIEESEEKEEEQDQAGQEYQQQMG